MGLASIILNGLAANYPNPGVFFELDFAQGPVAGSGSARSAILLGNKTAAGAATVDTVIYGPDTQTPVQDENDVVTQFGSGSQLHRAYLRFVAVNPSIALYFGVVAPSAGAAAATTEVFTTTATANGNCRVWCGDQFIDTAITLGDTPTVIGGNVAASVNSQTRWPVTANNVTGTVTYTHKNLGPEGNWLRMQALITSTGVIGTTSTLGANTNLTGGTTADTNANILATILSAQFYYIILCDSDAVNAGRAVTQLNAQAQPLIGKRQRVFFGGSDTLANTITVATALNAPRAELVWGGTSTDMTPLECAANAAAIYSLLEAGAPVGVARKNFSQFPMSANDQTLWLPTQVSGTNLPGAGGRAGVAGAPTVPQITSALNNGITPMTVIAGGKAQLVKRCTTKSLTGATQDYRIRDAHKVTECDWWGDDVVAITALQFGGKDIVPDQQQGQPPVSGNATSPTLWGNALKSVVTAWGNAGQWRYPPGVPQVAGQSPADVINANARIQQEINPSTRMSALFLLSPVDIFDQAAILAQQVG